MFTLMGSEKSKLRRFRKLLVIKRYDNQEMEGYSTYAVMTMDTAVIGAEGCLTPISDLFRNRHRFLQSM